MILARRHIIAGGLALWTACPKIALAHRQKLSISDLEWNASTNSLEIIHHVHQHDAETALLRLGLDLKPDLTKLRQQAKFALYLSDVYGLQNELSSHIPLKLIGAQTEGNYILVYQEAKLPKAPESLTIYCEILRDAFADQRNHVNVRLNATTTTLTFQGEEREKSTKDAVHDNASPSQ